MSNTIIYSPNIESSTIKQLHCKIILMALVPVHPSEKIRNNLNQINNKIVREKIPVVCQAYHPVLNKKNYT